MASLLAATAQIDKKYTKDGLLLKSKVDDLEQQYATISLIGPGLPQKHKNTMLMLRGNCVDSSEGVAWIEESMKTQNAEIGMYNAEMYCWCLFPPTEDTMASTEMHDEALYKVLRDYLIREQASNLDYETRREFLKNKSTAPPVEEVVEPKESDELPEPPPVDEVVEPKETDELPLQPPVPPPGSELDTPLEQPTKPIPSPFTSSGYKKMDQRFGVLAIADNDDKSLVAVKIYASKDTEVEAKDYAKTIQSENPLFNIVVVEMYKWLAMPPDVGAIADHSFANERLESLFTAHNEAQRKTQQALSSGELDESAPPPVLSIESGVEEEKGVDVEDVEDVEGFNTVD
jgi:hypothetical protein